MQLTEVQSKVSSGLNLSLFKFGPMVHVILGAIIASMVLVASTITIIVVSARAGYIKPVLLNDTDSTYKIAYKDTYVLSNDYDSRGATLKITKVTQPKYGTTTIMGDGSFIRYTPKNMGIKGPHYSGDDVYSYTAVNDKLDDVANVTISILNRPPEPVNLVYTVSKNSVDNVANVFVDRSSTGLVAVDPDNDDMSVVAIGSIPSNSGTAKISADGNQILFTPATNFKSSVTFSYTVSDGNDTAVATCSFTVKNDPPKARPDIYAIPQNKIALGLNLLENDSDPNGDGLTIIEIRNGGAKGTGIISNGGLTADYWPIKGVYQDSFEYTISDGDLTSASYVAISIRNTPPTSGDISVTFAKNSVGNNIPLTYSDVDPFTSLNITLKSNPTLGTATLSYVSEQIVSQMFAGVDRLIEWTNNTWTLNYHPNTGALGQDVFEYYVSDGMASATGKITVNIINTAPIAVDDSSNCKKNTLTTSSNTVSIPVTNNDSDPNGDNIEVLSTSGTSENGGSITIDSSKKSVTYKPAVGFLGVDTFTYTITDIQTDPALQLTSSAKVTVTVQNTAPVAVSDSYTVQRGNSQTFNVLTNDYDDNGDSLTIGVYDGTSTSGVNLTKVTENGVEKISYTALSGAPYNDTFQYKCNDGALNSEYTTVTIYVINGAPTAVDDSVNVKWNNSVIINALSNDNDINPSDVPLLTIVSPLTTNPSTGSAVIDGTQKSITYTPPNGFVGTTTFTYQNVDPLGARSNVATITVNVLNQRPVALDDNYLSVNHHCGTTKDYDVLANDSDPDTDPIAIIAVSTPSSGSASIVNGKIRYVAGNTPGNVQFTYTITDWNLQHTATVRISATNTPPTANPDSATIHWRSTGIVIPVLSNDDDADNDPITITELNTNGLKGTAVITPGSGAQTVTFVPDGINKGVTTFTYTITDGFQSATATVTVTVTNNDMPSVSNKNYNIHWRTQPSRVDVLTSKFDTDGDTLTLTTSGVAPSHTVTKLTDGSTGIDYLSYTQPANFRATTTFQYQVSDGLNSNQADISFTVYNNPPVPKNYAGLYVPYKQKSGLVVNAINDANDADVADRPFLTITSKTNGAKGTVTIINGGKGLNYTKFDAISGDDEFTYTIFDGAEYATGTVKLTIGLEELGAYDKYYSIHWSDAEAGTTLQVVQDPSIIANAKHVWLNLTTTLKPSNGYINYTAPFIMDDPGNPHVYYINYTSNRGFLGPDSLRIGSATDGNINSEIIVNVDITNTPPTSQNIQATTHWRLTAPTYYEVDFFAVCADDDNDPLKYVTSSVPTCGSIVYDNPSRKIRFTPSSTLGVCTFTYTVSDGIQSTTSTVSITVTNLIPITIAKYYTIHWKTHVAGYTMDIMSGDSDPNFDPLTLSTVNALSNAQAGSVVKSGSNATITGLSNSQFYNNNVTFTYVITDNAQSQNGLVNVRVYNTAPVAVNDNYNIVGKPSQQAVSYKVTQNDYDNDPQDTISIKSITYFGAGTATKTGTTNITYTPPTGFVGSEVVTYVLTDGIQDSTATATFTTTNAAPVANPDYVSIKWNAVATISPLLNDFDVDIPLTLQSLLTNPVAGTAVKQSNDVQYTPSQSQTYTLLNGKMQRNDSFDYRVIDMYGLFSTGTITVNIYNTPPVAVADSYSFSKTVANPTQVFNVLANDYDSDTDVIKIKTISYTSGNGATISITGGETTISYKPAASFRGVDTFTYTISDGQLTATATVTVTVQNQAPTCASSNQGTLVKRQQYTWDLTAIGSPQDQNGDSLTYSLSGTNTYDKADVLLSGSTITFTSKARRSGAYSFKWLVSDGLLSSTECTITVNINNLAPVGVSDYYELVRAPSVVHTLTVTSNDNDPDAGDSIKITATRDADNKISNSNIGGTISISGNQLSIVYTPKYSYLSPPSLRLYYTITDDDIDNPKTFETYMDVYISTNTPIAVDDVYYTEFNTNAVIPITTILANDYFNQTTSQTIVFKKIVDCATLDSSTYCMNGQQPAVSANGLSITLGYTLNSCSENKFRYCISTNSDSNAESCATVTVKYQNCVCQQAIDLIYVIDSSGSITSANWKVQMDFLENVTKALYFGVNSINVGVIQFGTNIYTAQGVSASQDTTLQTITYLRTRHMNAYTNTRGGLQGAIDVITSSSTRPTAPKVIMLLTDGLANLPCSCSSCDCDFNCGKGVTSPCSLCRSCSWDPDYGRFCQPCASAKALANSINSRKKPTYQANWKVVALGIGDELYYYNQKGWKSVQDMNYDPNDTLASPWNDLPSAISKLIDTSCNAQ